MSRLDDVLREAESLQPEDRLRLVIQIWESLPHELTAAQSSRQLSEIRSGLTTRSAARSQESPWDVVIRLLLPSSGIPTLLKPGLPRERPLGGSPPKLYAATRRFDLATVFVAMGGYSLFFGLMALLEVPPFWKLYLGAFIAIVGVGQALLERVTDPRRASIFVGAAAHSFLSLVIGLFAPELFLTNSFFFIVFINGLVLGGALGYMAGALVGGVFLVADALRGKFTWQEHSQSAVDADSNPPVHPLDNPLDSVVSPGVRT